MIFYINKNITDIWPVKYKISTTFEKYLFMKKPKLIIVFDFMEQFLKSRNAW